MFSRRREALMKVLSSEVSSLDRGELAPSYVCKSAPEYGHGEWNMAEKANMEKRALREPRRADFGGL